MNRTIDTVPTAGAPIEDGAPSWWHGDEAALAEARAFRAWVNRTGGGR